MKVFYRILSLILTLLTIDSETGTGIAIYQFSGELVFAIAKIQNAKGVRIPNNPHPYTPDTRHSAWYNLALILGEVRDYVLLPRFYTLVRNAKILRQNIRRRHREKLVRNARLRYRGWVYDQTLGFPGEGWSGWSRFSAAAWNTRSLTEERFKYAKSLGYDILARARRTLGPPKQIPNKQ